MRHTPPLPWFLEATSWKAGFQSALAQCLRPPLRVLSLTWKNEAPKGSPGRQGYCESDDPTIRCFAESICEELLTFVLPSVAAKCAVDHISIFYGPGTWSITPARETLLQPAPYQGFAWQRCRVETGLWKEAAFHRLAAYAARCLG
jgi:hypothetical protein